MLSVAKKPIILSVIMLSAVMLSVVAPFKNISAVPISLKIIQKKNYLNLSFYLATLKGEASYVNII